MRVFIPVVLLIVATLPPLTTRQETRLPCVADANLSSYEHERFLNYGASSRIRLKGIQMLGLFRFDCAAVKDRRVRSARLHLRYAGNDRKLRTLGLSTITVPWEQGDGTGERRVGQMCFEELRLGSLSWAPDARDLAEIIFRQPNLWSYEQVRDDGDGWISCSVPAPLVQAMVSGLATGLVVTDEKGQTMANNDVYSREQSNSQPYMTVDAQEATGASPGFLNSVTVRPAPEEADLLDGALRIALVASSATFGVRCALRVPGAAEALRTDVLTLGRAGHSVHVLTGLPPAQRLLLELTPVGMTGLSGPKVARTVTSSPCLARPRPLPSPPAYVGLRSPPLFEVGGLSIRIAGWDAILDPFGKLPVRSGDRLWDGKEVVLSAARGEVGALTLGIHAPADVKGTVNLRARGLPSPRFYILRSVRDQQWIPEVCEPCEGQITIGAANSTVNGQHIYQVLVELGGGYDTRPGVFRGAIEMRIAGAQPLVIPVTFEIAKLELPARPSFDLSLNTYGSPARTLDLDPLSQDGLRAEWAFHRLAHEHRGCLAPLGYSHSGNVEPGYAPLTAGSGRSRRVTDWSRWDARFGPLLDGSLFHDQPRRDQPVTHLYLPFHEAWPEDIRVAYRYQPTTTAYPGIIAEHALLAGTLDEMLVASYAEGIRATVRQFAEHIKERAWRATALHFYLNNKYYYRDPASGGHGTSWWLLDEPMHRDDWLALAWYARRMQEGLRGISGSRMIFREDVSRPQWQRDTLDGLVNLMVVNDELYERPSLMTRFKRGGVTLWHYGAPPPVGAPLSETEAWPVKAYLAGADGIVPWQSVGRVENLLSAEATALLLPAAAEVPTRVVASVRLKALRKGIEYVEHLVLLAKRRGWRRAQVRAAVEPYLRRKDFAGMRAAIRQALAGTAYGRERSQRRQRSGHAAFGRSRSPRPNP